MNHRKPFWTISSEVPISAPTTCIRKAWHLCCWRPRMVRTPWHSTGDRPQLWRNSKCQHGNRRRSRVWEKCRNSMHTVASKDIPSTVIPSFLQSPDEGQMSTPSFMPSMDSRCTARSFRQKSFTIFISKESPDQLCAGLWWSVLLSQWSKTMQSILQLAYWGTMICVFNK